MEIEKKLETTNLDKPRTEQKRLENLESGKAEIVSRIQAALEKSNKRPIEVLINGYAGSGKSYTAEQVRESLKAKGIRSIFIETDIYHEENGVEKYTHEDFFQQKADWQAGREFKYWNTSSHQEETIKGKSIDVIIIGGIGADKNAMGIDSALDVFMNNSFLSRLANKGLRDNIINTDNPQNSIETFMDDISGQSNNDFLEHMLSQERDLKRFKDSAQIVIENNQNNPRASIQFTNGKIIFEAEHEGKKYGAERDISPERMRLMISIIEINNAEKAQEMSDKVEAMQRAQDEVKITAVKKKLGS